MMTNFRRKLVLLVLISGLLVPALAGCGSTPEPQIVEKVVKETVIIEGTAQVIEKIVTQTVEKEVTREVESKDPGKVVIVQNAEIRFMDPTLRPTTADGFVILNIYNGLIERDRDMKLKPGLATSWKLLDDLTWEFELRQNVKFHNGESFNADTVVAWFERLHTVEGKIEGYQSSIDQIGSVDRVEKVDDDTIRFVTSIPDPLLPGRLSSYYCLIPPVKYLEENGYDALMEHGVGTGPYKFVEWTKDDHLLLEANSDYWDGAPEIGQLEFRPVPEASSRVAALKAGEAQIADAIVPALIPEIEADPDLGVVSVAEAVRKYRVTMNTIQGGPLADERVRQALNYAVDKQLIIDQLLAGRAVQTANLVTIQAFGYCEVPLYEYNPEKAKELLAEAGYADGFDLNMNYSPGHYVAEDEIVQAIGNYLEAVGIRITYVPHEWAARLALQREQKMDDLCYGGKTNLAMDADYIFSENLDGKQYGWSYPLKGKALELYELERQEMDNAKRADLACQVQKLWRDEAPVIFLWQQDLIFGISDKLDWTPRADGFTYGIDMGWK